MTTVYEEEKHIVAVDCAIFGYTEGKLKLLLYPSLHEPFVGKSSLVGGFVKGKETLKSAAERLLYQKVGVFDVYLNEVRCFSKADRDPVERVISVLHYALVGQDFIDKIDFKKYGARWWPVDSLPPLILDYDQMVAAAIHRLQKDANDQLLGKELLPPMFTLLQLRKVYEAIFQRSFEPANFRKRILSLGILLRHTSKNTTESKKGAYYYSFDPQSECKTLDRILKLI